MNIILIELIIISVLVGFQVVITWDLVNKIALYRRIFKALPMVEQKLVTLHTYNTANVPLIIDEEVNSEDEDVVEITILRDNSSNSVFNAIIYQINNYLIKNKGATIDYHLINDIVDRNTEIVENEINNRIPAPLYLGLVATMLGIIAGLLSVNFNAASNALNAIQPLIDGVQIAMSASVLGLIITTVFSIKIYKDANSNVEQDKNNFLSQLLSDLLPKMNKSKLPEVETLSNKLDIFARNTQGAITKFNDIVKESSSVVKYEQMLISDIKDLNVTEITSANVEVFNQLDTMMDSFDNFAKYYDELDKSMASTSSLLTNLNEFVRSSKNINVVLEDIKRIILKSDEASEFFNSHIRSFQKYGEAVNEVVANSNSSFIEALDQLKERTNEQFDLFNSVIGSYETKLSEAFDKSIENFNETMKDQVIRTEAAFNNSRPQFEKLKKLDTLDNIERRLSGLENKLTTVFTDNGNKIVSALGNLNYSSQGISNPKIINSKQDILEKITLSLKIATYVVIISFGVISLLSYFNLIV